MKYIIVLVVILTIVGLLVFAASSAKIGQSVTDAGQLATAVSPSPTEIPMDNNSQTPTPQGTVAPVTSLKIEDEVVGTGDEAVAGKSVTVNYTGTLTDGTKFDSNVDPKFLHVEPFVFPLGAGRVIEGWDKGVAGMKVGGKRKLTIPASMGYGAAGAPPSIPGNATLIFEVELLKVE